MLLTVYKGALCFLLFLLFTISLRHVFLAVWRTRSVRSRLTVRRSGRKKPRIPYAGKMLLHLEDLMAATRFIRSVQAFFLVTMLLFLSGTVAGVWFFKSLQGVAVLGSIWGLVPYLTLRMKLISGRLRTRLDFLPAVEVFYQVLLAELRPNLRLVLHEVLAGNRLRYPIKTSFAQLDRSLASGAEPEEALRIFRLELGHVWADYFANMLLIGIQEGADIRFSMKELIEDMRRAQLYDQKARNRLLEIRIASFTPALFLILFIGINLKMNYENAVRVYFEEAEGRNMLLHAVLLQFGSFLMGVYLSMRRM